MNALKNISKRICAAALAILILFTVTVAAYPKERVYAVDPVTLTIEEVIAWLLMSVGIYDNSGNDISSSPLYQRDSFVYQVQNSVYGQQSEYVQSGAFVSALDDMIDTAVNGVSDAIRVNEFLWETIKEWASESLRNSTVYSSDNVTYNLPISSYSSVSNLVGVKSFSDFESKFISQCNIVFNIISNSGVFCITRYDNNDGYIYCSFCAADSDFYEFDFSGSYLSYLTSNNSSKSKFSGFSFSFNKSSGALTYVQDFSSISVPLDRVLYVVDNRDYVEPSFSFVSIPWVVGNVLMKDVYDIVTKGRTKADNGSLIGDVAITIPGTKSISNIIEGLRAKEAADEDTYIPWVDVVTSVGAYPVSIADDIAITGTKTDEDEKEVPVVTPIGELIEVLEKAEVEEPTTEEENTEDLNEIPLDNISVPYVPAETGTYIENLKKKFPFCIPFDLVTCIQNFRNYSQADEAPVFTFTLPMSFIDYTWTFTVDMNDYLTYVKIFRFGFLILFLIGLMFSTSKLIGWQLID